MKWEIESGKEIINKYNDGIGVVEISLTYNIRQANIRHFLKKYNKQNWRGRRIYTLENENYFEKIDTNNKAYLLGFLCADGHVSERYGSEGFRIELQGRDREILEFYLKEIGSNKVIKNIFKKNKHYVRLTILSKKIRQDLNKLGIRHNKTYNLKMPLINQQYLSHFIRGYFDGDGCLYINNKQVKRCMFSIISTTDFCTCVNKIFKKELNIESKLVKDPKYIADISIIYVWGNRRIQKVLDYIYQNAQLFLTRKMNKYMEFKKIRAEHSHESIMKLSKEQVQEIRKRITNKETLRSIAKDYGISHGPISCIKSGKSYKCYE